MVRAGRSGLGLGPGGTEAGQLPEQMQRALLDLLDCEDGAGRPRREQHRKRR